MKSLFLDSSVVFAAVCSPTGGSAKILSLSNYKFIASSLVLTEVERNVRDKLYSYHLNRFFSLVENISIQNPMLKRNDLIKAEEFIIKKDATILAQAKSLKVDYLITLDKKDFLQSKVSAYDLPSKVVTPKIFLEMESLAD